MVCNVARVVEYPPAYFGDTTTIRCRFMGYWTWPAVTFGRLAVSDSELGVDVIDFDECYCYLFTVLYCSLVLHAGPF